MQQYYELAPSSVSFIDLAYFNEILRGITNTVKCHGIVSNTVKKLEGENLFFEFGDGSAFQGSFKSFGLPDVWNTKFQIELREAHLRPGDVASIYLPWFKMYYLISRWIVILLRIGLYFLSSSLSGVFFLFLVVM